MSPECFLYPSVGFVSGSEPPASQSVQERHKGDHFQVSNQAVICDMSGIFREK